MGKNNNNPTSKSNKNASKNNNNSTQQKDLDSTLGKAKEEFSREFLEIINKTGKQKEKSPNQNNKNKK
ncbi:hypothetical protein [Paenisporosarcina antarctica]|uniref:YfhD family protein n=1 Tax=Paenisporosarcina antarctica TaxID=417367 RepID=A0A4P7A2H0_9BACL|nr:hypothetical protein [Paenisporosarcina antarctica]QBP42858.1 hypothetical protein E2636_17690 [Paenisporosarcina antarctica]